MIGEPVIWFILVFYAFSLAILYLEHRHRLTQREALCRAEIEVLRERLRRTESRVATLEENAVKIF